MRPIAITFILTLSFYVNAKGSNSCLIEPYFKQTETYGNILLEKERLILDKDINELSLLPDIYLGTSQQSNNSKSFKSVDESGLYIGLSQNIYEGNKFKKNQERIKLELHGKDLLMLDKKNDYIINLFRDITDYKYKIDLRDLYKSQLDKQKMHIQASKSKLESGEIAAIEHEISSHRLKEILNNIDKISEEIIQAELDLQSKYHIPPQLIDGINYDMIASCKTESINHLLAENRTLELDREKIDYDINISSLKPSVSLSLNVAPPDSGSWNDLNFKKANFGLSVNASVPLSRFFSFSSCKKKHGLAVANINMSYDEKQKLFFREREKTKSKLAELEKSILLTKSKLKLNEKELDYVLSRFIEKKETILSYYRQLDEFEMEKINLKKEEREIEYYKAYLNLLD